MNLLVYSRLCSVVFPCWSKSSPSKLLPIQRAVDKYIRYDCNLDSTGYFDRRYPCGGADYVITRAHRAAIIIVTIPMK